MSGLNIIDRRLTPRGKNAANRQRFFSRERRAIKRAMKDKIRDGNIEDISKEKSRKLKLRTESTQEPIFHHGTDGVFRRVFTGNKDFSVGDVIPKPQSNGRGGEGSPDGEGEDDFYFEVSHEEFLQYVFEDLELPSMVKKMLSGSDEFKLERSGFSRSGAPNKLDVSMTMRQSLARKRAFRHPKKRRLNKLYEQKETLERVIHDLEHRSKDTSKERTELKAIEGRIRKLKAQLQAIPFIHTTDLRYRRYDLEPVPIAKAVMFCLMDVSGSMMKWHKDLAKRFFMLLYLFLTRNYERVELVFIRHTQYAKEVDEEEFFTSRETGGTMVSSSLKLMAQIMAKRYPLNQWNIYGCHASDGDNWTNDNIATYDALMEDILPYVQHFAYVEVDEDEQSTLWPVMEEVKKGTGPFAMARIQHTRDIYPVFRGLFERKGVSHDS